MKIPIAERIAGTTIRATWVNSGSAPVLICSTILDKNETLVDSQAAISSGSGLFYALHALPKTSAWYVNEWVASIGANTYVDRQFIRAIHPEVS